MNSVCRCTRRWSVRSRILTGLRRLSPTCTAQHSCRRLLCELSTSGNLIPLIGQSVFCRCSSALKQTDVTAELKDTLQSACFLLYCLAYESAENTRTVRADLMKWEKGPARGMNLHWQRMLSSVYFCFTLLYSLYISLLNSTQIHTKAAIRCFWSDYFLLDLSMYIPCV